MPVSLASLPARGENEMPVINHNDLPQLQMRPGIRGRFLAHKDTGAQAVSLLENQVDPGCNAPLHKHTVEETMLVLDGTIWVKVNDEEHTLGAGHTVIIPANAPHAWGNAGDTVANLLWAFAGPDPFSDATYLEGDAPNT